MSFSELQPEPRLPTTPSERRWMALLVALFSALFSAELVSNFTPQKYGALFVALFWAPVLVLHEAGHAWMAQALGWQVSEIVIGYGREVGRFRVGRTRVRMKMLPVEGYVVPHPRDTAHARLKSALIYAAGPGAELLFIGALWWVVGDELFEPTSSLALLAAQGAAVAAGIGALTNLVPRPVRGGVSDGLGIILSLATPSQAFHAHLATPYATQARRELTLEAPERALCSLDEARSVVDNDSRLTALRAVASAMQGDIDGAFGTLEAQGHPDEQPAEARAELLLAAAWVTLIAEDRTLFSQAEAACHRALESTPESAHARLLLGRLKFERSQIDEAYRIWMRGFQSSREAELDAQFCAYLALACRISGQPTTCQRFLGALDRNLLGPRLRAQLESTRAPEGSAAP